MRAEVAVGAAVIVKAPRESEGAAEGVLLETALTAGSKPAACGALAVAAAVMGSVPVEDAEELAQREGGAVAVKKALPDEAQEGVITAERVKEDERDAVPDLVLEGVAEGAARVTPPPGGAEMAMLRISAFIVVPGTVAPLSSLFQDVLLASFSVNLVTVVASRLLSTAGELSELASTTAVLL